MIREDKTRNALESLHFILIVGRHMALIGEPAPGAVAELLDTAEVLTRFLIDPGDSTDTYRMFLTELAAKYPDCAPAVQKFDEGANA